MATKKKGGLIPYPKSPAAGASLKVQENYLARCKEVDKKNAAKKADKAKLEKVKKDIKTLKSKRK